MKIIACKFFPPNYLINLFGVVFAKKRILMKRYFEQRGLNAAIPAQYMQGRAEFRTLDLNQQQLEILIGEEVLNEEAIHTAQMREWLYLFFYIAYLLEWIVTGFKYSEISFEKEAKENSSNLNYLKTRKHYSNYR